MRIVSLKTDFGFKEFMSNETVRKYFLAATLGLDIESIHSVRLQNPFLGRLFKWQKQGILDVLIEFNDSTKINIEMQVVKQKYWKQRNLFYLARMYVDDLLFGQHYSNLRRCIGISILDFNLDNNERGHRVYRMREKDGSEFSDMWELHIIELQKVFSTEDALADWVRLLNATTEEELDMIKSTNIGIQTGIKMVRNMSLTGWIRAEIEAREKIRRDQWAREEYIRDEARAEGLSEGRSEGLSEGLSEGRSEGLSEGLSEGRSKGRSEGQTDLVKTIQFLREGKTDSEILKAGIDEKTLELAKSVQ